MSLVRDRYAKPQSTPLLDIFGAETYTVRRPTSAGLREQRTRELIPTDVCGAWPGPAPHWRCVPCQHRPLPGGATKARSKHHRKPALLFFTYHVASVHRATTAIVGALSRQRCFGATSIDLASWSCETGDLSVLESLDPCETTLCDSSVVTRRSLLLLLQLQLQPQPTSTLRRRLRDGALDPLQTIAAAA